MSHSRRTRTERRLLDVCVGRIAARGGSSTMYSQIMYSQMRSQVVEWAGDGRGLIQQHLGSECEPVDAI